MVSVALCISSGLESICLVIIDICVHDDQFYRGTRGEITPTLNLLSTWIRIKSNALVSINVTVSIDGPPVLSKDFSDTLQLLSRQFQISLVVLCRSLSVRMKSNYYVKVMPRFNVGGDFFDWNRSIGL
jgi:hypothetical protein